jgi:hypothetical protein
MAHGCDSASRDIQQMPCDGASICIPLLGFDGVLLVFLVATEISSWLACYDAKDSRIGMDWLGTKKRHVQLLHRQAILKTTFTHK